MFGKQPQPDPVGDWERHVEDQENRNFLACFDTAKKNGHTNKEAENCDDGSVGCPDCPFGSIKEKYYKHKFAEVKREMVALIESQGLPVGFVREYADSYYGIRVNADRTIMVIGYAEEMRVHGTIDDLCMVDLAYLLDDQFAERGKSLDESFKLYL